MECVCLPWGLKRTWVQVRGRDAACTEAGDQTAAQGLAWCFFLQSPHPDACWGGDSGPAWFLGTTHSMETSPILWPSPGPGSASVPRVGPVSTALPSPLPLLWPAPALQLSTQTGGIWKWFCCGFCRCPASVAFVHPEDKIKNSPPGSVKHP